VRPQVAARAGGTLIAVFTNRSIAAIDFVLCQAQASCDKRKLYPRKEPQRRLFLHALSHTELQSYSNDTFLALTSSSELLTLLSPSPLAAARHGPRSSSICYTCPTSPANRLSIPSLHCFELHSRSHSCDTSIYLCAIAPKCPGVAPSPIKASC
jgi:hypothetical protein